MCVDPYGWMCDSCFASYQVNTSIEFCEECAETSTRMCFCCGTLQDKMVDEVCDMCKEDNF